MNEEQILSSIVPDIYVSKITLESSDQDKLISNLQFILKDRKPNNEISGWLTDNDVLKYLKILVIQSTDLETTQNLYNNKKQIASQLSTNQVNTNLFSRLLGDKVKNIQFSIFSIDPNNPQQYSKETTESNGTKTVDFYFNVNFGKELNITENPEHLSYIFGVYYDLNSFLGNRENFQFSTELISDILPFNLRVEKVISNYEVIAKSLVYITQDENIWSGEVHQLRGKIRSGVTEDSSSVDLNSVEIDNLKIQDYRQLKNILKLINLQDQLIADINLEPSTFDLELLNKKQNESVESSISELYSSVDKNNNISLTFFIDFKKMFLNNSIYAKILTNSNSELSRNFINLAYREASIERIVIKSKRIDIDESLVFSVQKENIVADLTGPILAESLKNTAFKDLLDSTQLKTFSVTEQTNKRYGSYSYSVEIEYKDNIVETLNQYIQDLKREQQLFSSYYEFSTFKKVFNQTLNRFELAEISKFPLFNSIQQIQENTGISLLEKILTIIGKLFYFDNNNEEISNINLLYTTLKNYLSPVIGTPESIWAVVRLYNSVIKVLSSFIASTPYYENSLNEKASGNVKASRLQKESKIITIKKHFANILNLNASYKLEYLDFQQKNTSNFSPTALYYEINKTDLINKKLNNSAFLNNETELNKQGSNIFDKLYNILGDCGNLKIERTPSISLKNIDLQTISPNLATNFINPINEIVLEQVSQARQLTDQEKNKLNITLLTLLNPTVNSSEEQLQFIIDSQQRTNYFWKIGLNPTIDNSGEQTLINNLLFNKQLVLGSLTFLPNQLKYLMKYRLSIPEDILKDAEVRFRFEMIKQISVLTGFTYKSKNATYFMNQPVWKTLIFADISNLQQQIFCKLEDYNNEYIKYKFNTALKELSTNDYIFITPVADDNFISNTGATRINIQKFNNRITTETRRYFGDSIDVEIRKSGQIYNPNDSIENSKYSFLSPLGFYYDNVYKTIDPSSALTVEDVIGSPISSLPIQTNINTIVNESLLFPTTNSIIERLGRIRETSVAASQNIVRAAPELVTNYSRNDIVTSVNVDNFPQIQQNIRTNIR